MFVTYLHNQSTRRAGVNLAKKLAKIATKKKTK
jgi:hypothetical protein